MGDLGVQQGDLNGTDQGPQGRPDGIRCYVQLCGSKAADSCQ